MKTPALYQFSEIPNNEEGRELLRLMRKYLNKDRYKLRARGQHLKQGLDWRKHQFGQGLKDSSHIRVYINERPEPPRDYARIWVREGDEMVEYTGSKD